MYMERSCSRVHEIRCWEEANKHESGVGLGDDSNDKCIQKRYQSPKGQCKKCLHLGVQNWSSTYVIDREPPFLTLLQACSLFSFYKPGDNLASLPIVSDILAFIG